MKLADAVPVPPAFSTEPVATARLTPSITVGGAAAQSLFTGLAPGFVGLVQFNFQLSAKLPAGSSLPLTTRFGNASSQTVNLHVR